MREAQSAPKTPQKKLQPTNCESTEVVLVFEPLFGAVSAEVMHRTWEFQAQTLVNGLWAFAKSSCASEDFMRAGSSRAFELVEALNAQDLTNTAWALATVRMANTAWGFGKVMLVQPGLFALIAEQSLQRIRKSGADGPGRPSECANFAWTLTHLMLVHTPCLAALGNRFVTGLRNGSTQNLTNTVALGPFCGPKGLLCSEAEQEDFETFFERYLSFLRTQPPDYGLPPSFEFGELGTDAARAPVSPALRGAQRMAAALPQGVVQHYEDFRQKMAMQKLRKLRSTIGSLPASAARAQLVEAVKEHPVTLVVGDTGCGKSTQVPQFLMEAGFRRVLVTQPRRLAAMSLARRVSAEQMDARGVVGQLGEMWWGEEPLTLRTDVVKRSQRKPFDCEPFLEVLRRLEGVLKEDEPGARGLRSGPVEIEALVGAIAERAQKSRKWLALPLHSQMPVEQQDRLFGQMDPFAPPEVQRAALEGPLLQVLALGIPLQRFRLPDPPRSETVAAALQRLLLMRAVVSLERARGGSRWPNELKAKEAARQKRRLDFEEGVLAEAGNFNRELNRRKTKRRKVTKVSKARLPENDGMAERMRRRNVEFELRYGDHRHSMRALESLTGQQEELLQLVVACAFYPNLALPNANNHERCSAECVFHTRHVPFVNLHPSSVLYPQLPALLGPNEGLAFGSILQTLGNGFGSFTGPRTTKGNK
eukprot:g10703.t1